jgi:hypothetical protein
MTKKQSCRDEQEKSKDIIQKDGNETMVRSAQKATIRATVKRKQSSNVSTSPRAHESLTKTLKINDKQRRRLRRLPKSELRKIFTIAGETVDPNVVPPSKQTKNYLAHAIARNSKVAEWRLVG